MLFSLPNDVLASLICLGETSLTSAEFAGSMEINYPSVVVFVYKNISCKASVGCDLMVIQCCCFQRAFTMQEMISSQFDT